MDFNNQGSWKDYETFRSHFSPAVDSIYTGWWLYSKGLCKERAKRQKKRDFFKGYLRFSGSVSVTRTLRSQEKYRGNVWYCFCYSYYIKMMCVQRGWYCGVWSEGISTDLSVHAEVEVWIILKSFIWFVHLEVYRLKQTLRACNRDFFCVCGISDSLSAWSAWVTYPILQNAKWMDHNVSFRTFS